MTCEKHGYDDEWGDGCPFCAAEDREAEKKAEVEAEEKARLVAIEKMIEHRVPPRYREARGAIPAVSLSLFWGPFGTGKTWEAYGAAMAVVRAGYVQEFGYYTAAGASALLRSDGSELRESPFLIVDEFGKASDSEYSLGLLSDMFSYRDAWDLPTILIVNAAKKEELPELIPHAMLDRFRGGLREFNGRSKREPRPMRFV